MAKGDSVLLLVDIADTLLMATKAINDEHATAAVLSLFSDIGCTIVTDDDGDHHVYIAAKPNGYKAGIATNLCSTRYTGYEAGSQDFRDGFTAASKAVTKAATAVALATVLYVNSTSGDDNE